MLQPKVRRCPSCESEVSERARNCDHCGRRLAPTATTIDFHVAQTLAKQKKTASKIFWLGLVVTFIGCLQATSSDVELAGNPVQTAFHAIVTAFMVYLAGLFTAAINSFTPPFLGDSVGTVSRVLILAGGATLIWACRYIAGAKGRSVKLGYLGVFGIIGVIILVLLPERQRMRAFS